MDADQLKKANANRKRHSEVMDAIEFWEGVRDQDNFNFKLDLSYLPGNRKCAPSAARFTEAEMVPIRAAKLHSLKTELQALEAEFAAY